MKQYLVKRVLLALGILFSISLITFFILNILPGDAVALMLGDTADPNTIETVRHNLGMDKPLPQQYIEWIAGVFTGDLGTSYFQRKPVLDLLATAFAYTAKLAVVSYLIALAVGLAAGIVSALNRGAILDKGLMTLTVVGISAPSFWVAILLQIFIGLRFKAIPISDLDSPVSYLHLSGAAVCRQHRPHYPHQYAGGHGAGLHPHRPGQGAVPPAHRAGAYVPQRPGAHHHRDRRRHRHVVRRKYADRVRI